MGNIIFRGMWGSRVLWNKDSSGILDCLRQKFTWLAAHVRQQSIWLREEFMFPSESRLNLHSTVICHGVSKLSDRFS